MPLLHFIGSTPGRVVRIVAGLSLIAAGSAAGGGWVVLAPIGLLPLVAGTFDLCVLGPLFGLPLAGKAFRARCEVR